MLADAGVIVTDATGTGVTVMADAPLFPSLVAVIVAVPAVFPVTSPLALTIATVALLLAQLTEIGRAHSELQSLAYLVCRLLLEKKKNNKMQTSYTETHTATPCEIL